MKAYYEDDAVTLYLGDCIEVIAALPDASVDALVSDPPYELGFMGKGWDRSGIAFRVDFWREACRVLKPGAYLLACGGTRTYHRLGSAIEDAGFEIRDVLAWLYGSGFPKSLNLGEGLGTALKPAYEPIVLARKPFKGTVKANVARFGTGALNVDLCRIGAGGQLRWEQPRDMGYHGGTDGGPCAAGESEYGRWPANVCLDDLAAMVLDEQSGECPSAYPGRPELAARYAGTPTDSDQRVYSQHHGAAGLSLSDTGGASRFFYVAKPSREERDYGCHGAARRSAGECTDRAEGSAGLSSPRAGAGRTGGARNFHPTVKPVELMRWLVRLVTPVNGVVLDPFMGSGTTGMAAKYEQRRFIGIEREPEYMAIAERRIAAVIPLFSTLASAGTGDVGSRPDQLRLDTRERTE